MAVTIQRLTILRRSIRAPRLLTPVRATSGCRVVSPRLVMSQAFVDLAPLVPAGARTVIVHGVPAGTRQQLAVLLPEATIHDLADAPDAVGADLAVTEVASHVGQARIAADLLELAARLREGAVLLVVTARRLGSARQLKTLEGMLGTAAVAQRSGPAVVLRAVRGPEVRPTADATAAAPAVEASLLGQDLCFQTGDGLFSKSRIDHGTRLLLEALPPEPRWRDVLDLGCGYGPIGIAAASRWPHLRVAMVDIDPAAVRAARTNIRLNDLDGRCEAHVSDGLSALPGRRFDAVLSHLPTHVPKPTLARLIEESATALQPGGDLITVTASAVDLRTPLAEVFDTVHVLAESHPNKSPQYRVVQATRPP